MFGKLIASLKSSEYAKNTVVIVWSDHGWQLGEKEHWRKFALWENVLRTVLMIQVPEGAAGLPEGSKNGATCERVVSTQDIYPTLVDLCGLPERKEIDGRSLVPLLRNPKLKWDYPAISSYDFSEFSIRNERFRYTTYVDGSEELYDHDADPEEWKNLANDPGYATTLEELRRHIPQDPAPLMKTSVEIRSFHIPPFKSREEYQDYVGHGKDMLYYINKYWK